MGSWGEVVSFLRAEGPGRRPGARLCPPRWAGGWPVTIGVPLSESIQVRVRVLRLDGEAAVRVRTTQVRDSAPWSSGSSTALAPPCGLAPHPVPPGFAETVETTPLGHGARPRARGPPGRGPAERTQRHRPPGPPGPESHAPARSGRGLPPPASRESRWAGDTHLHPHPGRDPIRLATAPGLLHEESSRVRDRGDHTRHRPLVYEAIDTAARRRPTRRDTTIHPAPDPRHPGPPPPSSPTTRRATALALRAGRTRTRRAGARAEAGRRPPSRNDRAHADSPPQEARPSRTPPPPRPTPAHISQTQPHPTPGGTGHPARPTRTTGPPSNKPSSPRHRFQSCPRHARQSTQQSTTPTTTPLPRPATTA